MKNIIDYYIDFESIFKDLCITWDYRYNVNSIKEHNAEMYGESMANAIDFMNNSNKYVMILHNCHYSREKNDINIYFHSEDDNGSFYWIRYNLDAGLVSFEKE